LTVGETLFWEANLTVEEIRKFMMGGGKKQIL